MQFDAVQKCKIKCFKRVPTKRAATNSEPAPSAASVRPGQKFIDGAPASSSATCPANTDQRGCGCDCVCDVIVFVFVVVVVVVVVLVGGVVALIRLC